MTVPPQYFPYLTSVCRTECDCLIITCCCERIPIRTVGDASDFIFMATYHSLFLFRFEHSTEKSNRHIQPMPEWFHRG